MLIFRTPLNIDTHKKFNHELRSTHESNKVSSQIPIKTIKK